MRLVKVTVVTLLVVTGCLSTTYKPSARQIKEQGEWQLTSAYGFPAWVARNRNKSGGLFSNRHLFI